MTMPIAASSAMMADMAVSGGVAGNGDHIQTDGADSGHCFQLFKRQGAASWLRRSCRRPRDDRNERAGKAADVGGSHYAALLNCVVEHREARRSYRVQPQLLKADLLEDMRDGVADSGCRRKGEVNDAERNSRVSGKPPLPTS